MKKLTGEDIKNAARASGKDRGRDYIRVGMSSCGIAAGAEEVFKELVEEAKKHNIQIAIEKCGCLGMCYAEPLVEVKVDSLPAVIYGRVDREVAAKIMEKHVSGKMLINDHIIDFKVKE
ncbi:MAG: (2Fe-2S) ferredoxin domain-containing protein [Deltaproteobacteria bacterium]